MLCVSTINKTIMKTTILTLALLLASQLLNAQTRGTQPDELYFSTPWYYETEGQYDMIIHSTNNGKNFKPIYVYKHNSGSMPVGQVLADAKPGVLYNQNFEGLSISNDNGISWELIDPDTSEYTPKYITGQFSGQIYKSVYGALFFSNNFSLNYVLTNDLIGGRKEIGLDIFNIYACYNDPVKSDLETTLHFSYNRGATFSSHIIDASISGKLISGYSPKITRGGASGELYLVSWHYPANYKIYRSTNYGESFELQYEQPDTCYFYSENYSFTAGRAPGEFYIFKNIPWYNGTNTKLHVYYSSDYAKTFTEYVHVFDKDWTGISEERRTENGEWMCYPNPFKQTTTIAHLGGTLRNGVVEIYNIDGQLIETIALVGNSVEWSSGNNKPGMYFYRIKAENYISKTNTMMKME